MTANDQSVAIFNYHSIAEHPLSDHYSVSQQRLVEHIEVLRSAGYLFTPLQDAISKLRQGSLPPLTCVITFDDGYEDFVETALPVLTDAGIVGTAFVPTAYLSGHDDWIVGSKAGRPIVSATCVQEIQSAGWEIGAHSHRHSELDRATAADLRDEVRRPKALLEDLLGAQVSMFAYPYGYHSARVRRAVREAGYDLAVEVSGRVCTARDNDYALPRITVSSAMGGLDMLDEACRARSRLGDLSATTKRVAWRGYRTLTGRLAK